MTGKIVADAIQRPNGDTFTLPMNVGQGGDVIVGADGQMAVRETVEVIATQYNRIFEIPETGVTTLDILWDDIKSGATLDNIAFVSFKGNGVNGSSSFKLYMKALAAAGVTRDTGYMGNNYFTKVSSNSSTSSDVSHNSNAGTMWFPMYTSGAARDYSYGGADMSFNINLRPHADADDKGVNLDYETAYQQSTSYNGRNVEVGGWGNHSTSAGIAGFDAGIRFYPSSGDLNRGYIEATLHMKPAA